MTMQKAKIPQTQVPALYDRKAGIYDVWGKLTETKARNRAIEVADIRDGQTILEVAVGTGLAFQEIVKRNPTGENRGIDISPGMLAKAKQRLSSSSGKYVLEIGSALAIDAEDQSVDLLLNNYMFDLMSQEDMGKALQEFHRVLRPGGKLVMVNMTLGEKPGSGIYEEVYRLSASTMGACRGVQISPVLPEYGFSVQLREYYQQMLFPSEVILALKD